MPLADLQTNASPERCFDPSAFEQFLTEWGLCSGDVVKVHSSWEILSSRSVTPGQLIGCLQNLVGDAGTLCMPAYPRMTSEDQIFDVRKTPSGAGMLSEIMRRMSGAKRSYQKRAVVALGRDAESLVAQHHLSPYASGKLSPYAQLAQKKGKVLCLGVGAITNTMFHCGEDILETEFPVNIYGREPKTFQVRTEKQAMLEVPAFIRSQRWSYCCDASRLLKYFDSNIIQHRTFHGIDCYLTDAHAFLTRLLELARQGVHMYGFKFPRPDKLARQCRQPVGKKAEPFAETPTV